jgi:hypothetical protein
LKTAYPQLPQGVKTFLVILVTLNYMDEDEDEDEDDDEDSAHSGEEESD